jgi:hypothetical protein
MGNFLPNKSHQKSVVESLNADVSANWSVSSALDISSAAHASKALASSTNSILIYSDSDVYLRFDQSASDTISTANDVILPAQTLMSIRVPNGLKASSDTAITVHFKQVTSVGTKTLRLVEV